MSDCYDQVALVKCLDNGMIVEADVLNWAEGKFLTVAIRTVRVNLQYNNSKKCYIGSTAGLEFQSDGPTL